MPRSFCTDLRLMSSSFSTACQDRINRGQIQALQLGCSQWPFINSARKWEINWPQSLSLAVGRPLNTALGKAFSALKHRQLCPQEPSLSNYSKFLKNNMICFQHDKHHFKCSKRHGKDTSVHPVKSPSMVETAQEEWNNCLIKVIAF